MGLALAEPESRRQVLAELGEVSEVSVPVRCEAVVLQTWLAAIKVDPPLPCRKEVEVTPDECVAVRAQLRGEREHFEVVNMLCNTERHVDVNEV